MTSHPLGGLPLRDTSTGVRFEVRVIPRASRSAIEGVRDGRLVVRVTAPPVDSAANDAVVALVARAFGVAKRDVRIASGHTGRTKVIDVSGRKAAEFASAVSAILD